MPGIVVGQLMQELTCGVLAACNAEHRGEVLGALSAAAEVWHQAHLQRATEQVARDPYRPEVGRKQLPRSARSDHQGSGLGGRDFDVPQFLQLTKLSLHRTGCDRALVPRKARDHLAEGVQLDGVDPNVIGMNHRRVGERGRGVDTRKAGFSVHQRQPPTDGRRSSRSRGRPTPRLLLLGVLGGKNLAHQVVWVVLTTIHALVGDQVLGGVHAWAPCRLGPATGSGR